MSRSDLARLPHMTLAALVQGMVNRRVREDLDSLSGIRDIGMRPPVGPFKVILDKGGRNVADVVPCFEIPFAACSKRRPLRDGDGGRNWHTWKRCSIGSQRPWMWGVCRDRLIGDLTINLGPIWFCWFRTWKPGEKE